jgi:Dolichyl-phosphate-mannose-protein mannosyltransferase
VEHTVRHAFALLVILLLAWNLREAWGDLHPAEPVGDTAIYEELARGLLETGVYGGKPEEEVEEEEEEETTEETGDEEPETEEFVDEETLVPSLIEEWKVESVKLEDKSSEYAEENERLKPSCERPPGWPAFLACLLWLFEEEAVTAETADTTPEDTSPETEGVDEEQTTNTTPEEASPETEGENEEEISETAAERVADAIVNVQIGLGVFAVFLIWVLGWQLFSSGIGLAAALLAAIYINHVALISTLCSEPLFLAIWMLALVLSVAGIKRSGWRGWTLFVVAALLFGAAAHVRPTPILLAPALLIAVILRRRWLGVSRWRWLAMALVFIATLVPWTVRNWRVSGHFIPIAATGGPNLYMGNSPSRTLYWLASWEDAYEPIEDRTTVALHLTSSRLAREYAIAHPQTTVMRWFVKLDHLIRPEMYFTVFNPDWYDQVEHFNSTLALCTWQWRLVLGGLAVWLMLLWLRRGDHELIEGITPAQLWVISLFGLWVAVHLITWAQPRFRHGIEPVMMIFAMAGWAAVWRAGHSRRSP